MMTEREMTLHRNMYSYYELGLLKKMLTQLMDECENYLGACHRNPECLQAKDEADQIWHMRTIYDYLVKFGERPSKDIERKIDNYSRLINPSLIAIDLGGVRFYVEDILTQEQRGLILHQVPAIRKVIEASDAKDDIAVFKLFCQEVEDRLGIHLQKINVSAVISI